MLRRRDFMLVAAMNPCPCGYFGDAFKACTCAPSTVTKYQKRISGPLLDRIDIQCRSAAGGVPEAERGSAGGEAYELIRGRVEAARQRQRQRFDDGKGQRNHVLTNADMRVGEIPQHCKLDAAGESLVRAAMGQMNLSARGYHRVLKVARSIADLAGSAAIATAHVAEAIQDRRLGRA